MRREAAILLSNTGQLTRDTHLPGAAAAPDGARTMAQPRPDPPPILTGTAVAAHATPLPRQPQPAGALCGRRRRALLLFGFAGALRRSELVALQDEDVAFAPGGLQLRTARGKIDPARHGHRDRPAQPPLQ